MSFAEYGLIYKYTLDYPIFIESVKSAAFEEWRLTFSSQMPITTISQIRQVRALAEAGTNKQLRLRSVTTSVF